MNDVTRYPIDFDSLSKGSVISAETIERFRQITCPTMEIHFAKMRLKNVIENELLKRGLSVVVKYRLNTLRILTDSEAAVDRDKMFHRKLAGAGGAFRQQCEVDVSNLKPDEKPAHEKRLTNNGMYVTALASAGPRYRLMPYQRATPGLPSVGSTSQTQEKSDVQAA